MTSVKLLDAGAAAVAGAAALGVALVFWYGVEMLARWWRGARGGEGTKIDHLPDSSKYVHLASLGAIALTTVLLIAPAAYHRIVERGEDTESFHRVASAFVLAAMVPLGLGIAGDLFVVVRKITTSSRLALVVSAAVLLLLYGAWFGFTLYRRRRDASSRARRHPGRRDVIERHAA